MDIQPIEQLLYYWTHSLCGLESHERSNWRATAPNTPCLFTGTTLCVYTTTPTKLTYMYLMTAYYTSNDSFTANEASFYNNEVGYLHILHIAVFFQFIAYTNIRINIIGTYYHTSSQVYCMPSNKKRNINYG